MISYCKTCELQRSGEKTESLELIITCGIALREGGAGRVWTRGRISLALQFMNSRLQSSQSWYC